MELNSEVKTESGRQEDKQEYEYKKFCYSVLAQDDYGADCNTEDNDPEYIFNEHILSPGWVYDVNELIPSPIVEVSHAGPDPSKIDLTEDREFNRILNQQLRQHIQLVTQTYLLTKNTSHMSDKAEEAKQHLETHMRMFQNKRKPSNLKPALDLINNLPIPLSPRTSIRLSWRPLPIPDSIKTIINNNPRVFPYSKLLPEVAFSILPAKLMTRKQKINFTFNEDKLLAYALNEFKSETASYAFIASLLMTAKTKTQISNHIKNIKRSPANINNPIKLYYANRELPEIDLDGESEIVDPAKIDEKVTEEVIPDPPSVNLDDLMAASTTISKPANINMYVNKSVKNLRLKKSILNLMSHNFSLSKSMEDLMTRDFLKACQHHLGDQNYVKLLYLLSNLARVEPNDDTIVKIYQEITRFLSSIRAPQELSERVVLFLNLNQAIRCGCSVSYLHWLRFFKFMQHAEMNHDGVEDLKKKLARLIDAIQRGDLHKEKLATASIINKNPFLKREFESLDLDEKPHESLFICKDDFDDITDPISTFHPSNQDYVPEERYEHFKLPMTEEELSYGSQSCPCKCHPSSVKSQQPSQHCGSCNLKFIRGRMYLVNKIKPILAEWSYVKPQSTDTTPPKQDTLDDQHATPATANSVSSWTFEEDREILEFCRSKAEQNEETITFDAGTFEELVAKKGDNFGPSKKSASQIAERFNQLMELMDVYKEGYSNSAN